jgi:hypothetical protein
MKSLTRGMVSDMKITLQAYTISVRKLNALLRTSGTGFELMNTNNDEPVVEQENLPEETGT